MAKRIDESQVKQVAKLARLELTEDEIAKFSVELSSILEYIEKLNELDVEGVEPLAHCLPIHNVFRDDIPKDSIGVEKALANAPKRYEEYFRVPKILDNSSGA